MLFLYVKALHIIFVVTWFAGLFYIVRLFIYHTEAEDKPQAEREILQAQFKIMEKRLWYGITYPSAVLTLFTGFSLLYLYGSFPFWLVLKLCFVMGLFLYHLYCGKLLKELHGNYFRYTSGKLRMWNEVATLFLVSIVFLVILKNGLSLIWGLLGLVIFSLVLISAIRIYKKIREQKKA